MRSLYGHPFWGRYSFVNSNRPFVRWVISLMSFKRNLFFVISFFLLNIIVFITILFLFFFIFVSYRAIGNKFFFFDSGST